MSHHRLYQKLLFAFLVSITGCVESFQPALRNDQLDGLVVDAFLRHPDGTVQVRISHTTALNDTSPAATETGAIVSIEGSDGNSYSLLPMGDGKYFRENIAIDLSKTYQLRIKTAKGKEYLSDDITISTTPDIDSVSVSGINDELNIMVSTHDQSGRSRYYAWTYNETWEYHAPQISSYKLVNKIPVLRNQSELIFKCWQSASGRAETVASSNNLGQDVISEFPLTKVAKGSQRISVLYSILIQQRVIGEAEFIYLDQLKKTSENLGNIFGPLPSTVSGNIHNISDPSEAVLGFFSGGQIKETRFFQPYSTLPLNLQQPTNEPGCSAQYVCVTNPPEGYSCSLNITDLSGSEYILNAFFAQDTVWGYSFSNIDCVDCRLKGGTLTKPEFW